MQTHATLCLKLSLCSLILSPAPPRQIIMLWNEVCGCRASGVFLRLSAAGLIAENNIHSNAEAGLDIRKGANPIILVTSLNSLQQWAAADSW